MLKYSFEYFNKLENNIDLFSIDIKDFLEFYISIEKNDKYEPIFSLTDKYKSFPINNGKCTKNFFQNNKWKINQNNSTIHKLKLSLNKLSSTNYDTIKSDIIDIINENNNLFNLFMEEIFEKVWFDEKFIDLYVKFCYDICQECPNSFNEVIDYCKKEFRKRLDYKKLFLSGNNNELLFRNKRKIIGTIEFIGHLYIKEYLDNNTINEIINSILNTNNIHDIDYESFYILWMIINKNNRLNNNDIIKNINIIRSQLDTLSNNRIKILLTTLIEELDDNSSDSDIEYINKCIIDYKKDKNIEVLISKLKNIDINTVLNEIIIYELENNDNLFIELIKKLGSKYIVNNIMNNIDLTELEFDIPNIKNNFSLLKKKLEL